MALSPARKRSILWLLCAATLVGALGFNIFSPILPTVAADLGTSIPALGQVATASALAAGLLSFIIGPISDQFGRRRTMVAGGVVLTLSNLATAIVPDYPTMLVVRMFSGLGAALLLPNATATVGDYFEGPERSRAVGLIVAFSGISTVVGWPVAGLVTEAFGWRVNFLILAVCFAVISVAMRIVMLPHAPSGGASGTRLGSFLGAYREVFRQPSVVPAIIALVLSTSAWFAFITYVGAFYNAAFSLASGQLSLILGLLGVAYFVAGTFNGQVARLLGDRNQALVTTVASGLVVLPFFLVRGSIEVSLVLLGIFASMRALNLSSFNTLLLGLSSEHRGTMLAASSALFQLGVMAGAGAGGVAISMGEAMLGDGYVMLGVLIAGLALGSAAIVQFAVPVSAAPKPEQPKQTEAA